MPAVEGFMDSDGAEKLRKMLGESMPTKRYAESQIMPIADQMAEHLVVDPTAELERTIAALRTVVRSECVLTEREIPLIGTGERIKAWIKEG